ncbi:hypothetical protein HII28_16620 [Planctomonas sp. JC2975]|uniref:hypothetical protein n=1 Tax=Planctomonas sp. JC2975 TaxID=2729626 RepID=UPI001474D364|nr:hypothetical protein [Planctomonas sp. JC2975]NNC13493.1 hypothetical protein [Planctomonas sp. JC2975]
MSHETPQSVGGVLDTHKVDFSTFANDISPDEWSKIVSVRPPIFFPSPIDTLSVTHPVGLGRTNTTLIQATIVQTDAATAYASFDRTANPSRNPVAQIHFEPDAYGITATRDYVVTFFLDAAATTTFAVSQFGASSASGTGNRTITGQQVITVGLNALPAAQPCYVAIEEISGQSWSWYKTVIAPPPLVFQL